MGKTRVYLTGKQHFRVQCDRPCNVLAMSDASLAKHERGVPGYPYYGGWCQRFPVVLRPPHAGNWNLVIDLGGRPGVVRYQIRIVNHAN